MKTKAIMMVLLAMGYCNLALADRGFKIAPEVSYIAYKESDLIDSNFQVINVKEKGVLYGVAGSFTAAERLYLKLDGRVAWGQVDYSGSGIINSVDDFLLEGRVVGGYVFRHKTFNLIPYIGFGYRFLEDDSSGRQTSSGAYGYLRQSNYEYLPVGLLVERNLNDAWAWEASAEADALLGGHQVSRLDEITIDGQSGFLPRVDNKQDGGGGFRVSLNMVHKGAFDLSIGPYFNWWKVQSSNDSNGFMEPKNSSTEVGGQIIIRF